MQTVNPLHNENTPYPSSSLQPKPETLLRTALWLVIVLAIALIGYTVVTNLLQTQQKNSLEQTLSNSPNLIFSAARATNYEANIRLNPTFLPFETWEKELEPLGTKSNRIVMAGGYTAPDSLPDGLTIVNGTVVNPTLQKFDGLIIIHPNHQIELTNVDNIRLNETVLHLKSNPTDLTTLLNIATKNKISILQSHLLLDKGMILIGEKASTRVFRRRVIFQTSDHQLYVYDSLDKKETLLETATRLKQQFGANTAINLDMGTYNYCWRNENQQITSFSEMGAGIVLSNLLVLDY
jgi:hypothetical protein